MGRHHHLVHEKIFQKVKKFINLEYDLHSSNMSINQKASGLNKRTMQCHQEMPIKEESSLSSSSLLESISESQFWFKFSSAFQESISCATG